MIVRPRPGGLQGPRKDDGPGDDAVAVFADLVRRWKAGEIGSCVAVKNRLLALGWAVSPKCKPGLVREGGER